MSAFAIFRLPYAESCTLILGDVLEVYTLAELNREQGFVVAPFASSSKEPILIIKPKQVMKVISKERRPLLDIETRDKLQACIPKDVLSLNDEIQGRINYQIDFGNFHSHLSNGDFQKLVLSRRLKVAREDHLTPLELFCQACEDYPRMFIALVSTPQSGCWLVSTPEVLLSGGGSQWQTVALAGTMPWKEQVEWNDKNKQEQRFVATYIIEQLEQYTHDIKEEGPYTVRAGHLAHLRSDFHFSLPDATKVGELLMALHPTPAVCGLPKKQALQFILQHEHTNRSYYSGFLGPLDLSGQTNLFVTLRCMKIYEKAYLLYAGGGLLPDSVEEQEWLETEAKLDTMRHIINHHV